MLSDSAVALDKIYPEGATQEEVYEEVRELVQTALDGQNVCIFSYGASRSGKTYTLEGPCEAQNYEQRGVI